MKKLALILFCCGLAVGSYFLGLVSAKRDSSFMAYDQTLLSLSNEILIHDALRANSADRAVPIVRSMMDADFARMVHLRNTFGFESSEYVRCAVTRKIRALRQAQGKAGEEALLQQGYAIDEMNDYLEAECRGAPSKENWAEIR